MQIKSEKESHNQAHINFNFPTELNFGFKKINYDFN